MANNYGASGNDVTELVHAASQIPANDVVRWQS